MPLRRDEVFWPFLLTNTVQLESYRLSCIQLLPDPLRLQLSSSYNIEVVVGHRNLKP